MTHQLSSRVQGALLAAGLCLGATAVHAASGYTVDKAQESLVSAGMSMTEVRQLLGRPATASHFASDPGPIFSYRVAGTDQSQFDVRFAGDGSVLSTDEHIDESGSGHGSRGGRR